MSAAVESDARDCAPTTTASRLRSIPRSAISWCAAASTLRRCWWLRPA